MDEETVVIDDPRCEGVDRELDSRGLIKMACRMAGYLATTPEVLADTPKERLARRRTQRVVTIESIGYVLDRSISRGRGSYDEHTRLYRLWEIELRPKIVALARGNSTKEIMPLLLMGLGKTFWRNRGKTRRDIEDYVAILGGIPARYPLTGLKSKEVGSNKMLHWIVRDLDAIRNKWGRVLVRTCLTGHTPYAPQFLGVQTEPVVIEGVDFGKFFIGLPLAADCYRELPEPESRIRFIPYTPRAPYTARGMNEEQLRVAVESQTLYYHPHVNHSLGLCFGDARVAVRGALQQGRLFDVFYLAQQRLFEYNAAGPYSPLSTWTGGWTCGECGTACPPPIPRCGINGCTNYITVCTSCQASRTTVSARCTFCGRPTCGSSGCLQWCAVGHHGVCRTCLDTQPESRAMYYEMGFGALKECMVCGLSGCTEHLRWVSLTGLGRGLKEVEGSRIIWRTLDGIVASSPGGDGCRGTSFRREPMICEACWKIVASMPVTIGDHGRVYSGFLTEKEIQDVEKTQEKPSNLHPESTTQGYGSSTPTRGYGSGSPVGYA